MLQKIWLLLCAALLFAGCAPGPETPAGTPQAALPHATPVQTPAPEGLEATLSANTWQDVYDDSFWLEFDLLQGTMTENNRVLKSKTTYRITIDTENSVFLAENGSEEKQFPFLLEDGSLTVDYGDPIGEILYRAVEKTP